MNTPRVLGEMNSAEQNGMNGTQNGMNDARNGMNGAMDRRSVDNGRWREVRGANNAALASLLEEIRQLSFVKTELELYLDTHPTCKVAIDYYHRTIDALSELMERYHAAGGNPLVAAGSVDTENWSWVNMPWPWHNTDNMNGNNAGGQR